MSGKRKRASLALALALSLFLPDRLRADDPPAQDGGMTPVPIDRDAGKMPERLLAPEREGEDEDRIDGPFAFNFLKRLEGDWEGSVSGEGSGDVRVAFAPGANGTVLLETAFPGTDREMVTVYFLEGPDLTVTHFHPAGNQPRLRLDQKRSYANRYYFKFAGGTGFDKSKDRHVHEGSIQFKGTDGLVIEHVLFDGLSRAGHITLNLRRSGASPEGSGDAAPGAQGHR